MPNDNTDPITAPKYNEMFQLVSEQRTSNNAQTVGRCVGIIKREE